MATFISRCHEYRRILWSFDIRKLMCTLQGQENHCSQRNKSNPTQKFLHISSYVYAGHNRWSKIHRKKAIADMEKCKINQKFVGLIFNSVRTDGGPDPELNTRLASIIEQAKEAGLSKTNIDTTIRRATAKHDSGETVIFEGRSEAGYMLVIETVTDNKNRTRPVLRTLLLKNGCILGESGSSLFNFDHKGIVRVPCRELQAANVDPMDLAIEVEAEDVTRDDNFELTNETDAELIQTDANLHDEVCFRFKCEPKDLKAISEAISKRSFSISSASFEYLPKTLVSLNQQDYDQALKVTNILCDQDEVVEVYDNFTLEN